MAKSVLKEGTPPIPMTLPTPMYRVLCEFSIRTLAVEQVQSILSFNVSTIVAYCEKQGWLEPVDKNVVQVIGSPSYRLCDGVEDLLWPLSVERSQPRVHHDHQGVDENGWLKSPKATIYVFDHSNFTAVQVFLPRIDVRRARVFWTGSEINWPSFGSQTLATTRLFQNAMQKALEVAAEADKQYPVGQDATI